MKIHARLKIFLWRVFAGVIPTKEVMVRRSGSGDLQCLICGAEVETLFHIFKECQGVKAIDFASIWGFKIDCWDVNNITDISSSCIHSKTGTIADRDER